MIFPQMSHKKTTDGDASRAISRLAALASRVTYVSMLPVLLACKTRHCRTIHPPLASSGFERCFVLFTQNKSDKKFQIPSTEELEKTDAFLILWDICEISCSGAGETDHHIQLGGGSRIIFQHMVDICLKCDHIAGVEMRLIFPCDNGHIAGKNGQILFRTGRVRM